MPFSSFSTTKARLPAFLAMTFALAACAQLLGLSDFSEGPDPDAGVAPKSDGAILDGDGQATATDTCTNGALDDDAGETDIDCGGSSCGKCAKGKKCKVNADCAKFCDAGICDGCEGETIPDAGGACIDKTEVRVVDFTTWIAKKPSPDRDDTRCRRIVGPTDSANPHLPVRNVDWCAAKYFCRSRGKKLCGAIGAGSASAAALTDQGRDQWYAACTGKQRNAYPYGGTYNKDRCNGVDKQVGGPWDAGSDIDCKNVDFDVFDLSGNVAEWEDACEDRAGREECVVRGGSYLSSEAGLACQSIDRRPPTAGYPDVGFRCCE